MLTKVSLEAIGYRVNNYLTNDDPTRKLINDLLDDYRARCYPEESHPDDELHRVTTSDLSGHDGDNY